MDQNILLWFFADTVVIIGAVVASHVATKVAIAKLQANGMNTLGRLEDLKLDHKVLSSKVDGISRHVSRTEAVHDRCPYVSGSNQN